MSAVAANGLDQLKQFIVDNNVVGTSAGVCIALATKDVIQSLVGDIIIPIVIILLHSLHIDLLAKYLCKNNKGKTTHILLRIRIRTHLIGHNHSI